MHGREACGVAELGLGDGKREGLFVREAERATAQEDLTDEVGDALMSGATANARKPFAGDRGIDQRVAPHCRSQVRETIGDAADRPVRDEGGAAARERSQAVIHGVEVEAHQVGDVARQMQRQDLSLTRAQHLVATDKALDDQAAFGGRLVLAQKVASGAKAFTRSGRSASASFSSPEIERSYRACG